MVLQGGRPLLRSSGLLPRLILGGSCHRESSRHNARQQRSTRSNAVQASAADVAAQAGWASRSTLAAAATLVAAAGSGLALAFNQPGQQQQQATAAAAAPASTAAQGEWVRELSEQPGAVKVLTAEALLAQEHPFLEDDHMFSAFVARGIIQDLEGWYLPSARRFCAVVALGRDVAGFPRVVHGGLTAAIFDEAFGGLLFSLKKARAVQFWGPAYTVQLEVSYKSKISAGAKILCTTEVESVEGRKLWMKATMSDGPEGKVYATARALFVAPKPQRLVMDVAKYLGQRLAESLPGRGREAAGPRQIDPSP